jgi:hypothetical protein
MDKPQSKFPTMGNSAATTAKNPSGAPERGKLMKKTGNAKGGTDPYKQAKPSRTFVKATGGRAYGIKTKMPSYVDPQIGPTQGNGRMFASKVNRTKVNFTDGMSDLN